MKTKKFSCKILAVYSDYLIVTKGYHIDKYSLSGNYIEHIGDIIDEKYSKYANYKLTRRLFRVEITGYYELIDNSLLLIAKKGFFLKKANESNFTKVLDIPRGSKPLNICIAENGKVYFGEYFQNIEKQEVHVYCSTDNCETWKIAYTFSAGNINHIHGLFFDPYTERIWILTGDRQNECIIGWTNDGFKTLHEELRGGQEYRSCQLFFYKDFIVFATDSQYIENEIRAIDRKTLRITTLQKVQGSVIKGGQCGNISYLSTTVEPSRVNLDKSSHVWISKDGTTWAEVFSAKKDWYPSILQYATIEFPNYFHIDNKLYFSGRAVKDLDGKSTSIDI